MSKLSALTAFHPETKETEILFSQLSSRCLFVVFLDFCLYVHKSRNVTVVIYNVVNVQYVHKCKAMVDY